METTYRYAVLRYVHDILGRYEAWSAEPVEIQ